MESATPTDRPRFAPLDGLIGERLRRAREREHEGDTAAVGRLKAQCATMLGFTKIVALPDTITSIAMREWVYGRSGPGKDDPWADDSKAMQDVFCCVPPGMRCEAAARLGSALMSSELRVCRGAQIGHRERGDEALARHVEAAAGGRRAGNVLVR